MAGARRLRKEEKVTIKELARRGESARGIARTMGVDESTVRYHVNREAEGREDGRVGRQSHRAASHAGLIEAWWEEHSGRSRPPNVRELHELLVAEHGYGGSYQSVRRYVRSRFPAPRRRTYRRVETPPGAQSQTDWGEYPRVRVGGEEEALSLFVMSLSHSRRPAMVWSRSKDQTAWLTCHNRSFERLGAVAAVNRVDNCKTAVSRGAGAWGEINPAYRRYATQVGFHVEACAPRAANHKGKVEAKVRLSRLLADVEGRDFEHLGELQSWTDERVEAWSDRTTCPATGDTVTRSWQAELAVMRALPVLPEPFDTVVTRRVHRDCTVNFEGRTYAVPFHLVGREVEVRGASGRVQVLTNGVVVQEYPRGTVERVLIDPSCYEGRSTERVQAPPPLGRMGRRMQEILELPVEERPLDLYAALAEVAS